MEKMFIRYIGCTDRSRKLTECQIIKIKVAMKEKYVLVTGGGGFIGSALVHTLVKQKARVVALDFPTRNRKNRLSKIDGLIEYLDIEKTDFHNLFRHYNFSHVFHLAGHANIPGSVQQPLLDLHLNVQLSLELLEAIRCFSPNSRIIFASSAAVYGEGRNSLLEESQYVEPISPYGAHKLTVELYLKIYNRIHDLKTASLRIFPVYGPGQTQWVIYDLTKKIHANPDKVPIHGDGEQIRDFIYVDDVVRAFVFVAENSPLQGDVYNVASGKGYSVKEIIKYISDLLKVDAHIVYEDSIKAGVSKSWLADITKIGRLGFSTQTSLQDGLDATVSWIITHDEECRKY